MKEIEQERDRERERIAIHRLGEANHAMEKMISYMYEHNGYDVHNINNSVWSIICVLNEGHRLILCFCMPPYMYKLQCRQRFVCVLYIQTVCRAIVYSACTS